MGYQQVEDFLTPPEKQQQQPDPMQEATVEAIKVDTQVKQGELKVKQDKVELDREEAKMDAKFKMAELATELETGQPMKIGP